LGSTDDAATFDVSVTSNTNVTINDETAGSDHVYPKTILFTDTSGTGTTSYLIKGSQQLVVEAGGGVTIDSSVTSDQAFTVGVRPDNGTTTYTNNGSGVLSFNQMTAYWSPDPLNALVVFDGTGGDITIGKLNDRSSTRTLQMTKKGSNRLNITGDGSYTKQTRLEGTGAVRITSGGALGTTAGNTEITGGENSVALELAGGITVAEPFLLRARTGAAVNAAHLLNASGNNVLTGAITTGTGGATFNIRSDADLLTIQGGFSETTTANDTLKLWGTGNGLFTGDISNPTVSGGQGKLNILKEEAGTWTLAGTTDTRDPDDLSAGTTTVKDGVLEVPGTIYSNLVVNAGAIFAPGASIGTADVTGDFSLDGTLAIEIDGVQTDLLNVNGNLDLSGGASVLDVAAVNETGAYTIATYTGTLTGTFATENLPSGYSVDYGSGSNSQISLVPEPSTLALASFGLLGLIGFGRRRKR
jgi:hypothetical protein